MALIIKPFSELVNYGNREVNMQTRFLKFLFLPVLSAILGHGIRRKAAISVVAMLMLTLSLVFPASATTETDYVTFSVGGFTTSGFNSPLGTAPTDPVTGSFTVTFDPTQGYAGDTADITLNSLTITTPGSPIAFDYYTSYPGGGDLTGNFNFRTITRILPLAWDP